MSAEHPGAAHGVLEVCAASPLLSVQDAGRRGLRHLGIGWAGPVDGDALALANALCANPPGAAGLEFAGPGAAFRATRALRFAVAGAECAITIEGRRVAAGESHRLEPGQTLRLGAPEGAVWACLALSGGVATAPVMGARATHLRAGLGGHEGRALRAGDRLALGAETSSPCLRPARPLQGASPRPPESGPIRVVMGPQEGHFAPEIRALFTSAPFTVSPRRDRMAMLLEGPALPAARGHDIVSDATVPGAIQVPGSGQPLVLLAESQTTGGYPKIATIASVDLARLAQLPAGHSLHFAPIAREEAEAAWLAQRRAVARVLEGLVPRAEASLSSHYLLGHDLVGGLFAPEAITGHDQPAHAHADAPAAPEGGSQFRHPKRGG